MALSIACRTICTGQFLGRPWDAGRGRPQDIGRRRPRDVGRGRPFVLHIEPYRDVPWTLQCHVLGTSVGDVLGTSARDVLRKSAGDVPWRYIEDHMETSIGRLSGTSSGRPRNVILPSGKITNSSCTGTSR